MGIIWLGSPLSTKFHPGIRSFVTLNPDYQVLLWLDHPESGAKISQELPVTVKDVNKQHFETRDLLDNCTNYAQMADIMRLEIVYLYGGIYVDMDATALRPFGPIFRQNFQSYRPPNWHPFDKSSISIQKASAGLQTNIFGFAKHSPFLKYLMAALRENFPLHSATLLRTGPVFVTEAILQYPFSSQLFVMDWDYVGGFGSSQQAIVMDPPGCHWDDKQDIRKKKIEL